MFSGIRNVNWKLFRLHCQHCTSLSDCTWAGLEHFCQVSWRKSQTDSINNQILLSRQLKKLEGEKEKLKNEMDFINSTTIAQLLHNPENEIQIKSMYCTCLDEIQKELHEKVFTIFKKYHWHLWKYLKKHLDIVLYCTSDVHSYKKISKYFLWLFIVLNIH